MFFMNPIFVAYIVYALSKLPDLFQYWGESLVRPRNIHHLSEVWQNPCNHLYVSLVERSLFHLLSLLHLTTVWVPTYQIQTVCES